jgi:hypothetical protein
MELRLYQCSRGSYLVYDFKRISPLVGAVCVNDPEFLNFFFTFDKVCLRFRSGCVHIEVFREVG